MSQARSLRWILVGLFVGLLLACGLDFSSPALEDVTFAEAADAGYTLPAGATHIHVQDFSSIDVRSTRFRFNLPPEEFDALIAKTRDSNEYRYHLRQWTTPESWPDFSTFGEAAAPPSWWEPKGDVGFRRQYSAVTSGGGSEMGSGSQLIFDRQTLTVHQWQWQWQWWEDTQQNNDFESGAELTVLVDPSLSAVSIEVICVNGYRDRNAVHDGRATVSNVPVQGECRLKILGGAPTQHWPVHGGSTISCSAANEGVLCRETARNAATDQTDQPS